MVNTVHVNSCASHRGVFFDEAGGVGCSSSVPCDVGGICQAGGSTVMRGMPRHPLLSWLRDKKVQLQGRCMAQSCGIQCGAVSRGICGAEHLEVHWFFQPISVSNGKAKDLVYSVCRIGAPLVSFCCCRCCMLLNLHVWVLNGRGYQSG